MIEYKSHELLLHALTPEGAQLVLHGSHEAQVWAALPLKGTSAPITMAILKQKVGEETAKVGQGRAFKNGWIGRENDGLVKLVSNAD
jgi:phenylalanyl-tRNA synthetase alpha chain